MADNDKMPPRIISPKITPVRNCNLRTKDFIPYSGFKRFNRRALGSLRAVIDTEPPEVVENYAQNCIRNCTALAMYNLFFNFGLAFGALKGIEGMLYK
ncbi:MAG: hypothetical protein A2256_03530 [Candidatus Staskawiczbacteria bacterium RIFOXYA2_FULL_32_7]|nr:MAG: hypothetical protein A2256_03530 [Candidatus Staskawiczbacteria bacterium RIFOXYA2_FULL_32_7]